MSFWGNELLEVLIFFMQVFQDFCRFIKSFRNSKHQLALLVPTTTDKQHFNCQFFTRSHFFDSSLRVFFKTTSIRTQKLSFFKLNFKLDYRCKKISHDENKIRLNLYIFTSFTYFRMIWKTIIYYHLKIICFCVEVLHLKNGSS